MPSLDDHIAQLKEDVARLQKDLDALLSGKFRLKERGPGSEWVDITHRLIHSDTKAIATLQSIIKKFEAELNEERTHTR